MAFQVRLVRLKIVSLYQTLVLLLVLGIVAAPVGVYLGADHSLRLIGQGPWALYDADFGQVCIGKGMRPLHEKKENVQAIRLGRVEGQHARFYLLAAPGHIGFVVEVIDSDETFVDMANPEELLCDDLEVSLAG